MPLDQHVERRHGKREPGIERRRCFTGVDPVLDSDPKFIAIDEEAN